MLVGLYGMESMIAGERIVDPRVVPFLEAVAHASDEAEARLPEEVIVERKAGVSVTLHWRVAPDREQEVLGVAAELARRYGLSELRTRCALELRPPVAIDKGTAMDAFIVGFSGRRMRATHRDLAALTRLHAQADGRIARRSASVCARRRCPPLALAAVDCLVDGPAGLADLLIGACALYQALGGDGRSRFREVTIVRSRPMGPGRRVSDRSCFAIIARSRDGVRACRARLLRFPGRTDASRSRRRGALPKRQPAGEAQQPVVLDGGPSFATRLRPSRWG